MSWAKVPAVYRVLAQVTVAPDDCWLVPLPKGNRYGRVWHDGRRVKAHRLTYQHFVGPIPAGLTIDHLCRQTGCVNPDHLEPVTSRENTLRGIGPTAVRARKTHCKYGHEFTPENTEVRPLGRQCRICRRAAA